MNTHKVTVILSLILIVALGVISYRVWQSDSARDYANAVKESAERSIATKIRAVEVNQEKAKIKAECDKENTYYNSLTTKQKASVPSPQCSLDTIQ